MPSTMTCDQHDKCPDSISCPDSKAHKENEHCLVCRNGRATKCVPIVTKSFAITEAGNGYLVTMYSEGKETQDLFLYLEMALEWIKTEWRRV